MRNDTADYPTPWADGSLQLDEGAGASCPDICIAPRTATPYNRSAMNTLTNQLIQLQELSFARDERKASSPQAPMEQLEASIAGIMKQLPEETANRFARLLRRSPLVVVPIARGNCSQCGLAVPHALVNAVRAGEQIHACPHCGRFLYHVDELPRWSRQATGQPPRPGIARFTATELMVPKLAATTREDVVAELAQALATNGFVENATVITELALRREAIISTAVESGLAFPHVRNVEGGGLTFALGLKEKGIQFDATDGKLSKIIFLIVIPTAASAFYLRLLAGLVRTFTVPEARKALRECETPEAMWKTLTKLTRLTVP